MPQKDFDKKLEDEDKTFVWIKRQVDEPIAKQIAALNIKGIYQRKEYKRQYPEGEAAAHVVGFTNVEDNGQEGIELAFNKDLAGKAGSRRVIKDRLGRVVEGVGEQVPPVDGKDIQLSVDSKVQFFAYQKLRDAVTAQQGQGRQRGGARRHHRRGAGAGQLPELRARQAAEPHRRAAAQPRAHRHLRARLDDEADHGRRWRWRPAASSRRRRSTPRPGRFSIGGFTISDTHNYGR